MRDLYQELTILAQGEGNTSLGRHFAAEPERFRRLSFRLNDEWLVDFSKQTLSPKVLDLLCLWAREKRLPAGIEQLFVDNMLNDTEERAVLHTALRMPADACVLHNGENVIPAVHAVLARMRSFCKQIHTGRWLGYSGKPITDVVNIGIGGSDLGPAMAVCALRSCHHTGVKAHFVSNLDAADLASVLAGLDPAQTLFVVSSKTFTTHETLTNGRSARQWLLAASNTPEAVARHFVAVSSNLQAVVDFGIAPENCFEFWSWVGGRFSLWSAIGLPIALAVGYEGFEQLLKGAHEVDCHFRHTALEQNIPVLMALITCWNSHFLGHNTEAVFPYSEDMALFPAFLQQLSMESNGKSTDHQGNRVAYPTSPLVWGDVGCNGQHAFFQLLHQGSHVVPADFIGFAEPHENWPGHHPGLLANMLAQTQALAFGRTRDEVERELVQQGCDSDQIARLAPYKVMEGNRPSTTMLCRRLTPFNLGALIAFYEHKTAVLGMLWNINSFDQWGVELGKKLAVPITEELKRGEASGKHDASTNGLIAQACRWTKPE